MDFTLLGNKLILNGKSGSGKSYLLKNILKQEIHKFNKIFLICPTEFMNSFYGDLIPKENIFEKYDEKWMLSLIQKLTEMKKNDNKKVFNTLLILDDVGSDLEFKKSNASKIMAVRGRHMSLSLVITSQYLYQIPPIIRSNANYVGVGQMNNQSVEILCDEYLFGSLTRKEFINLYHKSIKDYNFLLIKCDSVKNTEDLNQLYGLLHAP